MGAFAGQQVVNFNVKYKGIFSAKTVKAKTSGLPLAGRP